MSSVSSLRPVLLPNSTASEQKRVNSRGNVPICSDSSPRSRR